MKAALLGLLAESHVHPGVGQSNETVDLPVARERTTSYPFVPGSSCKGALREVVEQRLPADAERWFGKQDNAGQVMVSDARLLLLPVRSLTGAYRWLTCPHIVERLVRDRRRAGLTVPEAPFDFTALDGQGESRVLSAGAGRLFLEERSFTPAGPLPPGLAELLGGLIGDEQARARLAGQLAVVSDEEFGWFARYALSVQARNCLNEQKTSTNLWYEETLPPDTVMYVVLNDRHKADGGEAGGSAAVAELLRRHPYLQLGGNETVGQGWFLVRPLIAGEEEG
ncbi:type III-B CRISPR module RAMP protein Cmr4 [Azospirillum soli]|uniref:type III-B CRISPR module RAMP protein Cmr4 n=1 Tax=Azospirillum soli TaxID=1304799 RepID=UPI001AE14303|nr:type III-B CRISPR module RAMP protein Cmr4 [Azospirillum soli]MBP2310734.1 CRISPR-associated protein Cmr4 [Azospirillum soli]